MNTIAITPKSEDKYVVKVFNSSEFHLSEMTLLQNPYFSTNIFVTAISPTSNWNLLNNFAYLEHLNNSYGIILMAFFFGLHKKFDGLQAKLNIKKQYF